MTAEIVQLADAVAAELNRHVFAMPFEAKRAYRVLHDREELHDLRVNVVPRSRTIEPTDRHNNRIEARVDVGVFRLVDPTDLLAVDQLMTLVDEIADHLDRRQLTDLPGAAWIGVEQDPIYDSDLLNERRIFGAVVRPVYRIGGVS